MRRAIIFIIFFSVVESIKTGDYKYLPSASEGDIVKHENYALSYSEQFEQALWVAYQLTAKEVKGRFRRVNHYEKDSKIKSGTPSSADYKGTGYDRGHLAPARDMSFSYNAMLQSFYLSNISPQSPDFNRGIWKELENQVREWAVMLDSVYVITGGIFKSGEEKIGDNDLWVPEYFYKIVMDDELLNGQTTKDLAPVNSSKNDPTNNKYAIAFIMPNEGVDASLKNFVVSIDEIEEKTGIDFFPQIPDDLEKIIESDINIGYWDFSISDKAYEQALKRNQQEVENDHPNAPFNKMNINTASMQELDKLYGIGAVKARAIIEARPFQSIEELTNVKGIGKITLSRIRDYITVGDPENNSISE